VGGYDGSSGTGSANAPTMRLKLTVADDIYCVVNKGGGTATAYGNVIARRVR